MTNEQAIRALEFCPVTGGGLCRNIENGVCGMCDVREAVKTCISALREKLEREKGCEYCNMEIVPEDWADGNKSFIIGDIEYLSCEDCFFVSARKVRYCPFCGRDLTGGAERWNG